MILYYRWVLALVPLHVAGDLVLKLGEVLLHPLVEVANLLLDVYAMIDIAIQNHRKK
jgi:hypothetical protein